MCETNRNDAKNVKFLLQIRAIDSWEVFPFLFYFYINYYILNYTLFLNASLKHAYFQGLSLL